MNSSLPSPTPSSSFLDELFLGRVRWDLLRPLPEQDPAERRRGDELTASLAQLLRKQVDPSEVDRTRRLPEGLADALAEGGFLKLLTAPELGGLGLSAFNAFRVIETAASWSTPASVILSIHNGFGSASYLPIVPDGPLRDLITERVSAGMISGSADTEPNGAANRSRTTTAVPVEDGAAYLISGEKVFIGNGPLADFMDVSATVATDGEKQARVFFLDTRSPGFEVAGWHEFMGLRGAPIGALRLNSVRVPAEHMLSTWEIGASDWRDVPQVDWANTLARTLSIAPMSLAIAKLCLAWSRDFANRRSVDGRNLGTYDEIQRLVAETAADVFAIESIVEWGLLRGEQGNTKPELDAAKNLVSLTCWRVVDRAVSLFGGEGFETARSKARRGVPPLPVERAFRDARGLRIYGGVDFLLDIWFTRGRLAPHYSGLSNAQNAPERDGIDDEALSPRCREHLRFVAEQARQLASACRQLVGEYTRDEPFARQRTVAVLGQIGSELLNMSVVLARAAHLAERGMSEVLDLADITCAAARHRLAGLWPQLTETTEPDYAGTSDRWLHGTRLDFLLNDVITDLPPVAAADDRKVRP